MPDLTPPPAAPTPNPTPLPVPKQSEQQEAPTSLPPATPPAAPAAGQRAAFRELKLELTPEDLNNPGTQKCDLDMLFRAEEERDSLKKYVPKFYEADKQVGILGEQLKTNKVNEVMFVVGVGVGCTIMGLTPFFWGICASYGLVTLAVGALLTAGATKGRNLFK